MPELETPSLLAARVLSEGFSSSYSEDSRKQKSSSSPKSPLRDITNHSRKITEKGNVDHPTRSSISPNNSVGAPEQDVFENGDATVKEIILKCYRQVRTNGQKIDRLKGQVVEVKNEIAHLRHIPHRNQSIEAVDSDWEGDEARDGVSLPCKTLAQLKAFGKQLQEDKAYRKKICSKVHQDIDKKYTVSRNMGIILRKLISKDVGNKMTLLQKVEGKEVFKDLQLYHCLTAAFALKFGTKKEPFERKSFDQALKRVLNNSGDWEGGRSLRGKRSNSTQPNDPKDDLTLDDIFQ